jgi:hypothetical protein
MLLAGDDGASGHGQLDKELASIAVASNGELPEFRAWKL